MELDDCVLVDVQYRPWVALFLSLRSVESFPVELTVVGW